MAVSTGTALYPGASTFPGASVFPGQGTAPIIRLRYSTDDQTVLYPAWTNAESSLRSYSTSRGHDAPMSEMDPGTASFNMDNRTRTFDPLNNALIRPFNRWHLYEEFNGSVRDIYKGYALSYGQLWPEMGIDAVAVVNCADEFAVLAASALPVTSPPRESYAALISSDNPDGYWEMSEDPAARTRLAIDPVILPAPRVAGVLLQATVATDRRGDLRNSLLRSRRRRAIG